MVADKLSRKNVTLPGESNPPFSQSGTLTFRPQVLTLNRRDIPGARPRSPSAGGLLLGHLRVVKLLGANTSRTAAEPLPILLEGRTLFDHSEHHAEADLRANIEIGSSETVAGQIMSARHGVFERFQGQREISVTHHPLTFRRYDEAQGLVARRGLDRAGGEEQAPIIRRAHPMAGRRRKARLRKRIGEISADGRGLGDDSVALARR